MLDHARFLDFVEISHAHQRASLLSNVSKLKWASVEDERIDDWRLPLTRSALELCVMETRSAGQF
jgi:hypothetical protein